MPNTNELVTDSAYMLWLSWAFYGGLPEEAFIIALRTVKRETGLFLVPKRKHARCPIVAKKSHTALDGQDENASRSRR
jgi:hypothetical protein